MRGRLGLLACLALGVLALAGAPAALAGGGGTTTSAGDQQYVDPLAQTNSTAPSTTSAPAPTTSSAPATAPQPSASPASSAPQAPPPSTTAPASDPGGTLPYTGLNVGLVVAVGLGLLAAGLLLRRLSRRA